MLSFVQNWFAPRCNPIGVDFGTDCLRLAQVQWAGNEHKLVAAATADVPGHLRNDPAQRIAFFVDATRDLLSQGAFKGRQAVLGLPASWMHVQHLRLPRMDGEQLKKSLVFELAGKLPIDPNHALIRHLVAGDVYQDQDPKDEVIVMAAARERVNQLLAAAARAKLDVVGMNVEPQAVLDCFGHVYRRKTDAEVTSCFVDIGAVATRAIITRGQHILFARVIPVGGDHFTRAVATELKMAFEDAKMLRIKLAVFQPALDEHRERQAIAAPAPAQVPAPGKSDDEPQDGFALLSAGLQASQRQSQAAAAAPPVEPASPPAPARAEESAQQRQQRSQAQAVEAACAEPVRRLVQELDLCRRYYEATFPNKAVERLVFVGGEARQRGLCQSIARAMALAAQVGDPLVRMGRVSEIGIESGIDRRQPQPAWAVAIGLSMGPAGQAAGAAPAERATAAAATKA